MINRRLIFIAMVVIAIGFGMTSSAAERSKMQLIAVTPDGQGFVERDSGRPYIPFGTNYYDPHTGWAPKIWRQFNAEKVRQHFRLMSEIGVNCARVFLTAASFQPNAETIDERSLKKLDTLIKIARETGIRLILTGPDHWEGSPSYWRPDRFAGLVKADFTVKAWGRRFKELAANPAELKQPTPKLPSFNFPNALMAGNGELGQMHQAYAEAFQKVVGRPPSMKPANRSEKVGQ